MNASSRSSTAPSKTKGSTNDLIGTPADLEHHRLIDIKTLISITGDSRSGAYAKMNPKSDSYDKDHPVGVRLSKNAVRYRQGEVLDYVASRPRVRNEQGGERP